MTILVKNVFHSFKNVDLQKGAALLSSSEESSEGALTILLNLRDCWGEATGDLNLFVEGPALVSLSTLTP